MGGPVARTAAMQNHVLSVAGPRIWNNLPQEVGLFQVGLHVVCQYTFRSFEDLGLCLDCSWERLKERYMYTRFLSVILAAPQPVNTKSCFATSLMLS